MELASLLTAQSYTLLVILAILMMILRSNPKINNWTIQWIILAVALILSFIQSKEFNIDIILNAFIATGVCLFGENAIYRKRDEKTLEETELLHLLNEYKLNKEKENKDNININNELINLLKKDSISDIIKNKDLE